MPAHLRRVLLMAHIALSVSWIGAVGAFLALAILGQRSTDAVTVTSAYVAMNAISLFVVIPLSLCALISGMAMALLSPWGLIKHYWVLSKLTLTLLAAGMLMLHQFSAVAAAAQHVRASADALPSAGRLGLQLIVDGSLAIATLLAVVAMAVFKPRGMTPFAGKAAAAASLGGPRRWIFAGVLAAGAALFVIMHVTGLTAALH
ncbi:MAG: hypothetical protein JNJ73_19665 [Hyphomonadaceae bacterium]|nr:hypothetical protein [Hyphomonadaceae bacterium]